MLLSGTNTNQFPPNSKAIGDEEEDDDVLLTLQRTCRPSRARPGNSTRRASRSHNKAPASGCRSPCPGRGAPSTSRSGTRSCVCDEYLPTRCRQLVRTRIRAPSGGIPRTDPDPDPNPKRAPSRGQTALRSLTRLASSAGRDLLLSWRGTVIFLRLRLRRGVLARGRSTFLLLLGRPSDPRSKVQFSREGECEAHQGK
jgi:hypothetical protein